ncbi:NADH-quinone oxidoreductase subunit J [Hamadaea tsunoensis]|uniref:NADH-quinone oxidoreductase subunit J n=1 Tax=Hamadaea tsunoensis TaxID=53368 RepID=UPI000402BC5F|nr:NADH-quinone oxidoreductase subunit J [Hamadaea tsunoensis]
MTSALHLVAAAAAAGEVTTGEKAVFFILAPIALIGAIGMVAARNAVHSALWLVLTMLSLGVFYIVQAGPFIGMVQIIVYTGAIMMLFLFVLMLVGRDASDAVIETLRGQQAWAIVLGVGFAGLLGTGLARVVGSLKVVGLEQANADGNVQGIAALLFTKYVWVFEISSALLITAAVGAMILAHVDRSLRDGTAVMSQPERMRARFEPGSYPGPKPGPGVFATSTSIATPAKLPDGTPAQRSISPILPTRELTAAEVANKQTEGR